MDKSWITKSRTSAEYHEGMKQFLEFARTHAGNNELITCPCSRCFNGQLKNFKEVESHLTWNGFLETYTTWFCHGESIGAPSSNVGCDPPQELIVEDLPELQFEMNGTTDMQGLLEATFGLHGFHHDSFHDQGNEDGPEFVRSDDHIAEDASDGPSTDEGNRHVPSDVDKFYKLLDEASKPLYPECTNFSRLSFIVRLFHIKCLNGWSSASFTMLLELMCEAFPDSNLPKSAYETKKFMKSFGLDYQKIHACPSDCMLYRGDHENQESCHVCGASRWLTTPTDGKKPKVAKVLRYFPLIPRLQRLFMSSKTAEHMGWHDVGRNKDELGRHPSDSLAWKSFDERHPTFAADRRNMKLGISSDGVSPYKVKSTTYSVWPVIIIPYNLPPWMAMKQPNFILSMIIPGPKGPGNDIDVYLEPLIDELKTLWEGVETYDAFTKETFKMRAALLWTISDFPGLAMFFGRSTKGRYACPYCGEETCSRWLSNGKKFCYMGHRRWLSEDHVFRSQKELFDGTEEYRTAPTPLSGVEALQKLEGRTFIHGKMSRVSRKSAMKRKRAENGDQEEDDSTEVDAWKKKSIFFNLPYWSTNLVRHNIDVMHTEKNVCDNVLSTVMGIDGKSKDNLQSRLDLLEMNIRHDLHPYLTDNEEDFRDASYTMSKRGKDLFCKVLKNVKLPDGYGSNISKCISEKGHKIHLLKSHDYHILMQDLLPVALRRSLPDHVLAVIVELSNIFKGVCSKVLDMKQLDQLESRAITTLCHLERIFPPSFFTVMVHLVIHLVYEAKIAGPVHYRWMYPVERYLLRLKNYVRNPAQPEGSMAEGYLADECATFCSRYLEGIETRFNRLSRNNPNVQNDSETYLFHTRGRPLGKEDIVCLDPITLAQAHRYVLNEHEADLLPFQEEFLRELKRQFRRRRPKEHELDRLMHEKFYSWFRDHVSLLPIGQVSSHLVTLSKGPFNMAKRYKGYIFNGSRYHTKSQELHRKTQNSGILVSSRIKSYASSKDKNPVRGVVEYYGVLVDIIELNYSGVFKVILFRGNWVDADSGKWVKKDGYGITSVNFKHLIHTGKDISDEPFVFPSQVQQVYYVQDPVEDDWFFAIKTLPRDTLDPSADNYMGDSVKDNVAVSSPPTHLVGNRIDDDTNNLWVRRDRPEDMIIDA